jgi:CRISPR-associated protein Csb2
MLTGHAADGETLSKEHLAIVPLAHVDEHGHDRYADGNVLGVGLLLPETCSDDEYNLLISGLQRWLAAGGTVDIGANSWTMEVATNDHRRSLRANRLAGLSRTWVTATPVVCDRHARRDLRLEDVVGSMCRDAGLPAPQAVAAMSYSPVGGGG